MAYLVKAGVCPAHPHGSQRHVLALSALPLLLAAACTPDDQVIMLPGAGEPPNATAGDPGEGSAGAPGALPDGTPPGAAAGGSPIGPGDTSAAGAAGDASGDGTSTPNAGSGGSAQSSLEEWGQAPALTAAVNLDDDSLGRQA